MASFYGEYRNPAGDFSVAENPDGEGFIITVAVSDKSILKNLLDGDITTDEAQELYSRGWRPHSNGTVFDDEDDAYEWIENVEQRFEEQYDDYLEQNGFEIAQMERYEMWRNEY